LSRIGRRIADSGTQATSTKIAPSYRFLRRAGFYKIPFTCSYLPGKANVQFVFWFYLVLLIPLTDKGAHLEQRALQNPGSCAIMLGVLVLLAICIWWRRAWLAKSAVLKFEKVPPSDILGLGLLQDKALVIQPVPGQPQRP
ncbi:MAG: hypothetical protein ACYCOU_21465, partial [Sulfobacillus sp.]